MGLFESLFKKKPKIEIVPDGDYKMLTVYQPRFTSWGGQIYESERIRSAIDARARHISKLKVEIIGSARPTLQTKLKKAPNEFQTWSQFLYRASTILDVHNTCIIIPVFDKFGQTVGIYPVLPQNCEIKQANGQPYLVFKFSNGNTAAVEYNLCAVLTKYQYKNDFFGDTNGVLNPTMSLIDLQNQGIKEGIESSATFRFMAQMDNFAAAKDLAAERKRFSAEALRNNEDGFILFPSNYKNIQQISSKPFTIDADQMKAIDTSIFNYFGVNEDVLQNKAYGDAWSAFYEGAIEPFAIMLSETLTKALFTEREQAEGSYFAVTANRLQYMTTMDKLRVSSNLADRGILNRDEVREIWNLPPLPNGEGQAYVIRGEYKNADEQINGGTDVND